jgi:hypothetical protein
MTDTTVPGKGQSRILRLALIVSLSLNLAVVGLVIGTSLKFRARHFADQAPDLRKLRAQLRGDREALLAILRAEPFDTTGFTSVMANMRIRYTEPSRQAEAALLEVIMRMSPAERRDLADGVEAEMQRPPGPRNGHRNGPRDGHCTGMPTAQWAGRTQWPISESQACSTTTPKRSWPGIPGLALGSAAVLIHFDPVAAQGFGA